MSGRPLIGGDKSIDSAFFDRRAVQVRPTCKLRNQCIGTCGCLGTSVRPLEKQGVPSHDVVSRT
jgi:hypothetical protein